jgi:hypothetical protein
VYVRRELDRIMSLPAFEYGVEGALAAPDARDRVRTVTLPRLEQLGL